MKYLLVLLALLFVSCQKFLDEKPDAKLTTPSTYSDLLAILDHSFVSYSQPGLLEIAADNYFLTDANWSGITNEHYRNAYLWVKEPTHDSFWNNPYRTIFYCNTVLDYADRVSNDNKGKTIEEIMGIAYFHRAYSLFNIAQVFCEYYGSDSDNDKLGLVIKLNSDINEKLQRSSLKDTYGQIFDDMRKASALLSESAEDYPTRPNKIAALGMLSRMSLAIGRYEEAFAYADSCLRYNVETLDYRAIASDKPYPFSPYNKDVIFHSGMQPTTIMVDSRAMVDSLLYESYTEHDLRKRLFFRENNDGTVAFTGNYHTFNNYVFNGLTVAEMLLNKAESAYRTGEIEIARSTIDILLEKRYEEKPNLDVADDQLIMLIMEERRKELIFRGLRWIDLRRLAYINQGTEPSRKLQNETYTLTSEEILGYTFLIPQLATERGGLIQNN